MIIIPLIIRKKATREIIDALEDIIRKCPESAELILQILEEFYGG